MATADSGLYPLKRRRSFLFQPPDMSGLRVVLLGNSWSQMSSVGNLILRNIVFNPEEEPDHSVIERGRWEKTDIDVINSPDLLHPDISAETLNQHVQNVADLSDPGPHVFLLVLQPEDFTEEHKEKLCRFLETFSDQSFDHSLVLISPPRELHPVKKYTEPHHLEEIIRKSRGRHLLQKNLEPSELLKYMNQIVKENNGEHVSYEVFQDATPALRVSQFRIMLLGKSENKQTRLSNTITNDRKHFSLTHRASSDGEWRGKPVTVVKTPDMFSLSVKDVIREMKIWESLCPPGPNVLLLLVKPSDFTEENRQRLKFFLSLFGQDVFKHSMVIMTHEEEMNKSVDKLLKDCRGRHHSMSEDDRDLLMKKIQMIVNENRGSFLTFTEETRGPKSEDMNPSLNLVLCGRRGAGKTSAAEVILDEPDLHSVSDSSQCVRHQGEVRGRWVSLVELPALYGKPQEVVMKESLRCVSLCDPEGVHAFILVLPVGPLTDEDKTELEIIQDTFSSRVNDFTMILFTVESDPSAPAVVNFVKENKEMQDLCQRCGGRYVVLNIKDKQQMQEMFNVVNEIGLDKAKPCSYTTHVFAQAKTDKISQQQQHISKLEAALKDLKTKKPLTCDEEDQSPDCLRIVLVGKTGSGKSSSGNTILCLTGVESE